MILNYIDCYKLDHRRQYPEGTNLVFSNWTPRKSLFKDTDEVNLVGLQYFIKRYLIEAFDEFFRSDINKICQKYEEKAVRVLNLKSFGTQHIRELHALQYVPLSIRALPEGSKGKIGNPSLTMWNTHPRFAWLVNYIETILSATLWLPSTSATTARKYFETFSSFAESTAGNKQFIPYQGHDFSFRGMGGLESACLSGLGHLVYFEGTDCYPAIDLIEEYYGGAQVGSSVPATEHSVMCAHGADNEIETFEYLLDLYPEGIVSVVSDTWDLWKVIDEFLPKLKNKILSRGGKLVIRPDSGDPVQIILESIPKLWDVFGGTINSKGFKVLDSHIGLIYGDSITLERQRAILAGLQKLGFSSDNIVLGIGSFTYQYTTRDIYGHAVKATYCEVNGQPRNIFKDPVTDDGGKKSAKGLLALHEEKLLQQCQWEIVKSSSNQLVPIFENSKLLKEYSFEEVRQNAKA